MRKKQKILIAIIMAILIIIPMAGPNRPGGGTGTTSITDENVINS